MSRAKISVKEILAFNERLHEISREDPKVQYGLSNGERASVRRLEAIVERIPNGQADEQAAWLLRAIILVQPFPDGNHRTALAAARMILERDGHTFAPSVEDAEAFQRAISSARYRLLGGYDDAPLSILGSWDDAVMETCRRFVRDHLA